MITEQQVVYGEKVLIDGYKNNEDGYVYTDWYDVITNSFASSMIQNFSIRGGSDRVTYYFGVGYSDDETIFKTDGYNYDRYSFSGNITAKITDSLTASYQTSMRFTDQMEPGSGDVEW